MSEFIGQTIGQYKIIALLGEGGMATVYRAQQPTMRREVAIKIIESRLARNPEFVRRFEREAQTVASLNHPHILKVFDSGQQDDLLYLVMELQSGGSLSQLIRTQGRLPSARIAKLTEQIASALDYAHGRGIIHRDLKPQNVLLDEQGNAILTDFGIAKIVQPDVTALTGTGTAMGTPSYMSPEQWQGGTIDQRSDIYALGVMLYEMLSGTLPFSSDTPAGMMYMHINQPPPLIRGTRPDLPDAVEKVLIKALAKQPEQRFNNAGELAEAFRFALEGKTPPGIDVTAIESTAYAPNVGVIRPPTPTIPDPTPLHPTAPQSGRRGIFVVGGGLIALLAVVFAVLLGSNLLNAPLEATQTSVAGTAAALNTTPSETPSITPTATETPTPTHTSTPTASATPTHTLTATTSPSATANPQTLAAQTAAVQLTQTAEVNAIETFVQQNILNANATGTAIAVASFTKTPTPSRTFTPTRTATPTRTHTLTPTRTLTPTPNRTQTVAVITRTAQARALALTATRAAIRTATARVPTLNRTATAIAALPAPVPGARLVFEPSNGRLYTDQLWSHGFFFRRAADQQYRFIFDSNRRYALIYSFRQNSNADWEFVTVTSGNLPATANLGTGSSNLVRLVVQGSQATFFMNNSRVAVLDVSRYQGSGAVQIGTGFYTGSEKAGASTRYERFTIWSLPATAAVPTRVPTRTPTRVPTLNRTATAIAALPAPVPGARLVFEPSNGRLWSHGFFFRRAADRQYRFIFDSNRRYALIYSFRQSSNADWEFVTVASGNLPSATNLSRGSSNVVRLVVQGRTAIFYMNGTRVATLDVSRHQGSGAVQIGTGFYTGSEKAGAVTRYERFTVWSLP
ncbi:serine/threonine protein kinase [Chloroflexi bacterium CFX3]|nr:serine/threonine protein kinase [Chloroflexi bacterium CFX3]